MNIIDREISWLNFNRRCLNLASTNTVPLGERLNFLGITDNNLTEFISVRLSYLLTGKQLELKDEFTMDFESKYHNTLEEIHKFKRDQYSVYEELCPVVRYEDVKKHKKLDNYFENNILFELTPCDINSVILNDDELYIAVSIENNIYVISIDNKLPRLVENVTIESIVINNLSKIFIKQKISEIVMFRVYHHILDMESDNIDDIKDYLNQRKINNDIIFMDFNGSEKLIHDIRKIFSVPSSRIFVTDKELMLKFLMDYNGCEKYPKFNSEYVNVNLEYLINNELILHHPFQSFQTVIDIMEEAAEDSNVLAIKQTLYRVSGIDSPIIKALIKAAKYGKKVSVLIELKARGNENINIMVADYLKKFGIQVLFGKIKVHSKFLLIVYRKRQKLHLVSHISTGNYNEKTARTYTDISYFTNNKKVGSELNDMFNMFSGISKPNKKYTIWSPFDIKKKLIKLIKKEKNCVCIKVNSICDKDIINAIEKASAKGIKFKIICRGICSLIPNKNIEIHSVVGRFLEHSRIFMFSDESVYISSADLMTRNLEKRVEVMVPLVGESASIVSEIFKRIWKEDCYIMDSNGNYDIKK